MGIKNIYERFIWFDDQTRRGKYPNTSRLSEEFEISIKTAQRDIEFMRDRLSCPLIYDESLKGYCYDDETFSLPLMYLSSSELSALIMARRMLQDISGGSLSEEIGSAVDKITAIIRRHAASPDRMDNVMSFHLIEYCPVPEDIFRAALEACIRKKTITISYRSPAKGEQTLREVNPYHLFNYMGAWHLVGYCHLRKAIRDFKLGRIGDLTILDQSFSIPRDFNAGDYFRSSFGIYKGTMKKQVLLRFSPETAKWLSDRIWHRDQKMKFLADGSMELSFPVSDFSEITREILKNGAGVEVIKPEALRQIIKAEAVRIAKIY